MRKFNIKQLLAILFCMALLSACRTPLLYTSVDVLRAAEVEFSPEVKRLLVVNNSTPQTKQTTAVKNTKKVTSTEIDLEADSLALFTLTVLTQEMEEKDFFESVELELNSIRKNNDFNTIIPLKPVKIKELCKKHKADAILSLDKIKMTDNLSYYLLEDYSYLQELEVQSESFWSIHYPEKGTSKSIHLKDSLFWESEGYSERIAASGMPLRKDALVDAALYVGKNSVKRFIPYWEKKTRYFFNSKDATMQQAMDSVAVQNWEEAIKLFSKAEESTKSKKTEAEAANNIAIAYEFLGDFEKSYEYALLSLEKFLNIESLNKKETIQRLTELISELQIRQKELNDLNKQLGK